MIETPPGSRLERRLAEIHGRVVELLDGYRPDAVAIEELYFGANVRTAFAVGQARGVVLLAAGQRGIPSRSYTPQQVKGAVCGNGRAGKDQVGRMVARLLGLSEPPSPDHAADALAVAICECNRAPLERALARTASRERAHDRAGVRAPSPSAAPTTSSSTAAASATGSRSRPRRCGTCPRSARACVLHTHLVVRDDALALYGFATEEERELFLMLIGVQSVGPKVALAVLSGGPPRELLAALAAGDTARLQAAPGVGKRTAERIIVELREKVGATRHRSGGARQRLAATTRASLARDGLLGLGYTADRGRRAARRRRGRAARGADRVRAEDGPPMSPVREIATTRPAARRSESRIRRSCPRTISTARCVPAGSRTSSARRPSRTSSRSRSRRPPAAARRSTTCCSPGPPGLGKTSLAQIVAAELGVPFVQTAGPALERKGDVAAFLTALEPRAVFFVDEIHRLPRALEETFYPAMEDGCLPITVGQGAGARVVTLAAAAVHADRRDDPRRAAHHAAARPLRDPAPPRALRRSTTWRRSSAARRGCSRWRSRTAAPSRSRERSRGTPRVANRLLKRVRDYAEVRGSGVVTGEVGDRRRSTCSQVDHEGLDRLDREILRAICEKFGGGPVGLSTLAVAVGEEQDTIEDVYEPYLLQRGLIERTPRGRAATRRAFAHLGLEPPGPLSLL